MLSVEKKALLQILLGTTLNSIEVNNLKQLPARAIQKSLLESFDPNPEHETTADEGSSVDIGYQTASCDQYSSTFWANETLPSSYTFGRPAFIDGEKKSQSKQENAISKKSKVEIESSSIVRIRNPDLGNIRVNSNAAVDGAIHFLKLATEIKAPGAHYQLLSQSSTPLRTFTNVFDVAKGIEELIRYIVEMKRAKDGQNDYHNNIVGLLSRVCAVDRQVRDCVIEKLEKLMTLASSDEEDIWCLSLFLMDLCTNNTTICLKLMNMLVRLFLLTTKTNVKQSEYSQVQSTYCFCILHTVKTILKVCKKRLENSTEKNTHSTLHQFTTLKCDLVKILTNSKENHNLLLVSYNVQKIIEHTQECIELLEQQAFSLICS
ncbi:hypothetical protein LSTR_LSTR010258 [Laodelphax striatellus]|uniref:Uncharacterized protein n=1 Tax=Laodelphax striatellus TaxID=195883 RepID=A0A482XQ80_LAOST|nr:hypothetical protein LSTR_LSTR010258 [Laodelphax striatellus]